MLTLRPLGPAGRGGDAPGVLGAEWLGLGELWLLAGLVEEICVVLLRELTPPHTHTHTCACTATPLPLPPEPQVQSLWLEAPGTPLSSPLILGT